MQIVRERHKLVSSLFAIVAAAAAMAG